MILKEIKCEYLINGREKSWIKLKADYLEGMADSVDLVIMGGYF
jgi:ATP-dependent DNA ligase